MLTDGLQNFFCWTKSWSVTPTLEGLMIPKVAVQSFKSYFKKSHCSCGIMSLRQPPVELLCYFICDSEGIYYSGQLRCQNSPSYMIQSVVKLLNYLLVVICDTDKVYI